MLNAYRIATEIAEPFLPWWLWIRKKRGKEDPARLGERFGLSSIPRPKGTLVWIHAASVGEANSVLELIHKLRAQLPQVYILMTTGTVTSAQLMKTRLPKGCVHQYVPLDTQQYTSRFMRHWKPDVALFVESELWPNLILNADFYQCFMGLINGRMSKRSFASWQKRPEMIRNLISRFSFVVAQSEEDAKRFKALGAKNCEDMGNLKYDATTLPCDEAELLNMQKTIGDRPLWLAASTHPGEEEQIAGAHALLSVTRGNLLTIIVPRHPGRGEQIAHMLRAKGKVALRSKKEPIAADTNFYVADTLGELGLFYRLSQVAFMGGSLDVHGGQNPLEAARFACAIVSGPDTQNFADIYTHMQKAGACTVLKNAKQIAPQIDRLLGNSAARDTAGKKARNFVETQQGATDKLLAALMPVLKDMAK